MPARRHIFATHRALARALAQMAPDYTQKVTAMVAKALAEGDSNAVAALRHLLSDAEFSRACARAVAIQQEGDIALFDRYSRHCKMALGSCCRKVCNLVISVRNWRRVRNK